VTEYPKFKNDRGLPDIEIGVKEFRCTGTSVPHDHPHIYLNMGTASSIVCPYCATFAVWRPDQRSAWRIARLSFLKTSSAAEFLAFRRTAGYRLQHANHRYESRRLRP